MHWFLTGNVWKQLRSAPRFPCTMIRWSPAEKIAFALITTYKIQSDVILDYITRISVVEKWTQFKLKVNVQLVPLFYHIFPTYKHVTVAEDGDVVAVAVQNSFRVSSGTDLTPVFDLLESVANMTTDSLKLRACQTHDAFSMVFVKGKGKHRCAISAYLHSRLCASRPLRRL